MAYIVKNFTTFSFSTIVLRNPEFCMAQIASLFHPKSILIVRVSLNIVKTLSLPYLTGNAWNIQQKPLGLNFETL